MTTDATDNPRFVTHDSATKSNRDRFVRIPPNGQVCPHTSLKHAQLYQLLLHGRARRHVRVAQLREPNASRGVTLFHLGDFLAWIEAIAAEQGSRSGETEDV